MTALESRVAAHLLTYCGKDESRRLWSNIPGATDAQLYKVLDRWTPTTIEAVFKQQASNEKDPQE